MNAAPEQLLTKKATLNSHQRELAQKAKIATCEMRPRLQRPSKRWESNMQLQLGRWRPIIKLQSRKQKVHGATEAQALEQSHEESVL